MQEAIAAADPLQQPTLDTVVEELGQVPRGYAALPEHKPQTNMLKYNCPDSKLANCQLGDATPLVKEQVGSCQQCL